MGEEKRYFPSLQRGDSVGGIYESGTWIAPVEPTPEPTTDTTNEVVK